MKRLIIIAVVILMAILLFNKLEVKAPLDTSLDTSLNNMIGCMDYDYVYKLNVPATMIFYVIEKNEEDREGFFKTIDARGDTEGSTILHCGNEYFLVVSAPGYKEYTEKIPGMNFRPIVPEVHEINLETK